MTDEELGEVRKLIGLLAMWSTQASFIWVDSTFDTIVKYGSNEQVERIAIKTYRHDAEKMISNTKDVLVRRGEMRP